VSYYYQKQNNTILLLLVPLIVYIILNADIVGWYSYILQRKTFTPELRKKTPAPSRLLAFSPSRLLAFRRGVATHLSSPLVLCPLSSEEKTEMRERKRR